MTLFASKWTTKPMLIVLVLISSMTAYFMNAYNVIINDHMIRNMTQTDIHETLDLLSVKQAIYFLLLGLLPAYLIYKAPIQYYASLKQALLAKLKQIAILLGVVAVIGFLFYKPFASFFREHKPLRYATNPLYWVYSVGNYTHATLSSGNTEVQPIGTDASINRGDDHKRKIVILVVGEATRADHFSLNGYTKETTPKLQQVKDLISFKDVYSCGTSTAHSVPCMFSIYTREEYSHKKGKQTENILDVLQRTNEISILWRDNNSDSKGVALRVEFQYFKNEFYNTQCYEGECRDEGMIIGLDSYIDAQKEKDVLIVLHQMGNHGPAYYKRYPKAFEKFTPVCKTNQLEACSQEEISNAYDNAILYTDDFLVKAIDLLKKYASTHHTALIYMSDHGESLGENGIYLHGLPYFMAPKAQKHIPALIWTNASLKQKLRLADIDANKRWSHDHLFHSLLGLFDVETSIYNKKLDIFQTHIKQ